MPDRDEPTLAELEDALRIREDELERDCEEQAEMFYHVARASAEAVSRRDWAKQALSELESELDAKIRHQADVAGDRITESAVKAQIKLEKRYQRAAAEVAKLNTEVGRLVALRESYDHRKEMLKLMVRLYLANYFSDIEVRSTEMNMRDGAARFAERVNDAARRSEGNSTERARRRNDTRLEWPDNPRDSRDHRR
jgi:hypothetical protein